MSKIIDSNSKVIIEDNQYSYGTVIDYLQSKNFMVIEYKSLTDLIKTLNGDASTVFNTLGEMIQNIPDIINYGDDCEVLCVIDNDVDDNVNWFVLGWDYEDNTKLANKILNTYFPYYKVIENYDNN